MKGWRVCVVCGHKTNALSFAHPFVHCGQPMAYYTVYEEQEEALEPIQDIDDAINQLEAIERIEKLGKSVRACISIVIDYLEKIKENEHADRESPPKVQQGE